MEIKDNHLSLKLKGKKIILFSGEKANIGVVTDFDDDFFELDIGTGDTEETTKIPYLLPKAYVTTIGQDADAIIGSMEALRKKAKEEASKPKIEIIPGGA